jgi:Tol biopolymer transport system component
LWNYIALKYGDQKIGEILMRIKATRNVDQGFRAAIGLSIRELSDRWQKEQKVLYWPDVAKREEAGDYARRLTDHTKEGGFYNTSPAISPRGDKVAYISNRDEYFDVFLMNTAEGSTPEKIIKGQRTVDFEELHLLTPGMAWSGDGRRLALATKSGARDAIIIIDTDNDSQEKIEFNLDGIFSIDWASGSPDSGRPLGKLTFAADNHGHSDIYVYDLDTKVLTNLTDDIFSDADPAWSADGKSIFFSSDRTTYLDRNAIPRRFKMQHYNFSQVDLYKMDVATRKITRLTDLPGSDETKPIATPDGRHLLFISDMNGINNIYLEDIDSMKIVPLTNSLSGVYQLTLSADGNKLIFSTLANAGFDLFLMRNPLDLSRKYTTELEKTEYYRRLSTRYRNPDTVATAKSDTVKLGDNIIIRKTQGRDSSAAYGNETKIDLRNYVFNDAFRDVNEKKSDTTAFPAVADNIDTSGNYKVSKYKLNFSPDIVYGNAGYSTFYGIQGSTIFAFSDLLGDHQIFILSNLLFDLKNSDFALAYLYLPKRIDYGLQIFHQARFLFLTDASNQDYLYRFRNYGLTGMASLPVNRFDRWEVDLTWYNISQENLDNPLVPTQYRSLIVPTLTYIHDTSLWDILSPGAGERYNVSLTLSPRLGNESSGFWSLTGDYRTYYRLGRHYNLMFRFAGGGSFGANPQHFTIGGVDNWINRQFEQNRYPINTPEDIVFLTFGVPLRGYNYNQRLGTKYGLFNTELRFPLFGYLTAGPLPLFFQTLTGVLFMDAGGAWTRSSDFRGTLRDDAGDVQLNDILVGAGYGVRAVFLGFLLKMDVAWPIDLASPSSPKYYFSLGMDL